MGIFLETFLQFAQRLTGRVHDSQNLERADNSVAGRREIAKNDVAALFAAEIELPRDHFFDHITIPDFGANYLSAVLGEDFIQTKVAHHRCDERVVAELTGLQ